jgi:hypothetical protein
MMQYVVVISQGKFVVALKGVMNQKMPYYGLHDPNHLVALSRNRMYVNLMNIETGQSPELNHLNAADVYIRQIL